MTYNVFGGTLNLAQSAKFDSCSSLSVIISNSAACYTRRLWSKVVVKGSRDLLFNFWDPIHISGTVEARNFKFGTQIGRWGPKRYNAKLGQKGS